MEDGNSVGDVPDIPRRNEVSMTIPSLWLECLQYKVLRV
jgi:hypothetical protein